MHDADGRIMGLQPNLLQGMLWLAVVGCCTAMAMPIVHLVSHATDLGYPRVRAAELLTVLFIAAFISRIFFGMIADRIGALRTLLFGSACQAVMLLTLSMVDSLAGLYVAALLFGLGFAGIMPCYPLLIRLLYPVHQLGWRVAGQYMFASFGMALGGWLGGYVFDVTGSYSNAFLAGFGFNVMNLALIASIYFRRNRMNVSPLPV